MEENNTPADPAIVIKANVEDRSINISGTNKALSLTKRISVSQLRSLLLAAADPTDAEIQSAAPIAAQTIQCDLPQSSSSDPNTSVISEPPKKKKKTDTGFSSESVSEPIILLPSSPPLPLQVVSASIIPKGPTSPIMSGRSTNNSNKNNGKPDKNKNNKSSAEGPKDGPENTSAEDNIVQIKPSEPQNNIADQVINHFTSHWDKFKEGFRTDLDKLVNTVGDKKTGLVKKVGKLEAQFTSLENRVLNLQTAAEGRDTTETDIVSRLESLEKKFEQITDTNEGELVVKMPDLEDMESDIGILRRDVNTISGYVHVMDRSIKSVDHKSTMNAAKLMRNTLIFGGVRSTAEQSAEEALRIFLNNILKVKPGQDDIIEASKLGTGYKRLVDNEERNFPPPIRARCSDVYAAKVMRNAHTLYGKQDEEFHFKYYIRYSMPEAHKAVRDQHAPAIREYRSQNATRGENDPKTTFYFNGDRFFVNGEAVRQDITPPTLRDMLSLREETLDKMQELQFSAAGPIDEKDSIFTAYAIHVNSLEDIDLAYMGVRQVKRYADHIVCAYRLKTADGITDGGTHDKEYYGDQEILKVIRQKHAVNLAVFVSREYGGVPLGPKRFEIIRNISANAIEDLEPEVIAAEEEPTNSRPLPQRARRKQPYRQHFNTRGRGSTGPRRGHGGRGGRARGKGNQNSPWNGTPPRTDAEYNDID